MKSAFWVAAILFTLTLMVLSACGAGGGQVTVPTSDSKVLPSTVLTVLLPVSMATVEAQVPRPVVSVGPPQNSTTAAIEATSVVQRTSTELSYSAGVATDVAAYAKMAPTFTAEAVLREAALRPEPKSARVEQGRAYSFRLYTHCGVDFLTDFDGSFWDAIEKNYAPRTLDFQLQNGTMTLTDEHIARFDFEGGSVLFARHVGQKVLTGFCK